MTTELTRQLIAEPEGEGVSFAVVVTLGIVQEREVQIIDFAGGDPFAGIEDTEGEAVLGRFIAAHFKGDFADLGCRDGVLDQHQQNATQRVTVAVALIVGPQRVVD